MIAWTIEAALRSGLFKSVIVSTEDSEIASIAEVHGVSVQMRPSELATDTVGVAEVARYVLSTTSDTAEAFCLLMANCPLRTDADIVGAHERFAQSGADGVMSVVRYGWLRPDWALAESLGWLGPIPGAPDLLRYGPDRLPLCPSGAIRWMKTAALLANPTFYPVRLLGYELPWYRAVDIDTEEDLEFARCIAHAARTGFRFRAGSSS
jgi:N-acylneuraminate cytidylyltransferase